MSLMEVRGGKPKILRQTVDSTGGKIWLRQFCKYLQIKATAAPVKMYFTEDDYDADTNYWTLNEWEGPVDINELWLVSTAASSTVEMIAYDRKG